MADQSRISDRLPVVVAGGGIIGLSVGWQLLRRGVPVIIFERDEAARGASWAAAGMLAPHSEVGFEEEEFLRLGIESLSLFPRFLDEVAEDSGRRVEIDRRGTLIVGFHRDDTERIHRLWEFRDHLGLRVEWLPGAEGREIEPLLSPKISASIWLPDDGQVNNRALVDALKEAFIARGGRLVERAAVEAIVVENGAAKGVRARDEIVRASRVVVAAGCWSGRIEGIPDAVKPPVRPVKGQLVSLRMTDGFEFTHVVRAPDAYLLPKDDGRLLVGATQEEMGFDLTPTAGPVMRLIERGWEAIPSIYDLAIEGIDVGLRPGSRDNEPLIGPTEVENLYYATGHHRHGILLAPVTAYALCEMMIDGKTSDLLAPFHPSRFSKPGRR